MKDAPAAKKFEKWNPSWWQWALPLVGMILLIYWNSLSGDFVFDDVPLIKDSQEIRSWKNLPQIFGRTGYRPIRTLTYALDYWLFGPDPFFFHLTNVLMHAANAILVFLLLRGIFRNARSALAGALLFSCHPAQTAAVAYISGRKDVLATGFILAALLCFVRYRESANKNRPVLLGSLALFLLALFSKEVAVVFPALLFGWDFFDSHWGPDAFKQERLWQRAKKVFLDHRWLYGPMLLGGMAFLYYAQFVMYASRKKGFWGGSALNNYLTSIKLFCHYLWLAIFPYPLVADYRGIFPVAAGMRDWTVWVGLVLAIAFFYSLYRAMRRRPRMAFGLFWFLVTLLPVIQLLPFHEIAANHYLYLPLVGFFIAAVELANWKLSTVSTKGLAGAVAVLLLVYSAETVVRNPDWHDTLSLWKATVKHAPDSARVQNNLGSALHAAGDLDAAYPHLLRATQLDPTDGAYWSNLGAWYLDRLEFQAAIDALSRSVEIDPKNAYSQTNLGNAYKKLALSRGEKDPDGPLWRAALGHLRMAVALTPADGTLQYNLGLAYYQLGQREKAREAFVKAVELSPSFPRAYLALGMMDNEDGNVSRATVEVAQSIIRDANNLEAIRLLADIYVMKQNDYGAGRMLLEFAVDKFPNDSNLRRRLGVVYQQLGDRGKACDQLKLALQLASPGGQANEIRQILDSLQCR
ncbi:MAG TPA: tetratricopeptide repeat protein [Acidobacteriota bacterium]|nr:tetratricopeptide repeat protein [Acidobacteriota bacterium]